MKRFLLYSILGILLPSQGFSQEDSTILKIREEFNKWQPIIEKEFYNCDKLYSYAWGENYQFDKWFDKKVENDSISLSKAVSVIEKKDLGCFVYVDFYSLSGDWYIAVDYYYDSEGQLYFIYWRMNTFYADEPVTVEKRLYFDKNQQLIRDLKSVFKMNTKEKADISFMDQEVDYKLTLSDIDFYTNWKKKQEE